MKKRKIILFHLDPLDEYETMVSHRTGVYVSFARTMQRKGHFLIFYGRSASASFAERASVFDLVLTSGMERFDWPFYGAYHALAFANNLPDAVAFSAQSEYEKIGLVPDIVVTNTPSSLVQCAFPSAKIFHYELGFFNRHPFPIFHQFDPWGYSYKSLLARFPWFFVGVCEGEMRELDNLRNKIINNSPLSHNQVGVDDSVFFPLQSASNWSVRLESGLTRVQIIKYVSNKYKNKLVKISEKKNYPLLPSELEIVSKLENVQLMEYADSGSEGGVMAARCKNVFSMSPSLTLQAIFWGNKLSTLPGSSMASWAGEYCNSEKILASYFSRLIIRDHEDFDEYVERMNVYYE